MTPREGVDVGDMRACPFCNEADFDAVGLKVHLSSGHCEAYESTPSPARTVRVGSPHPAATAREEALAKCVEALDAMLCAHGEKSWSLKDPVNSFPGFPGHGGWGGAGVNTRTVAEAALVALALARSVKGTEA